MIRYLERNADDIIQYVEVELTGQEREDLERKVTHGKYKDEYKDIIRYEDGDNKLVYKTEVLIPKVQKADRLNLLLVLGNPATHSVQSGMFFAYEKRRGSKQGLENWAEHRFWTALRDCGVLRFCEDIAKPTHDNIEAVNRYKRDHLLNGIYKSDFNIFILPYFSFPTPSSAGVRGIKSIVGETIFAKMKETEFYRFTETVVSNEVKNIICFSNMAWDEILRDKSLSKSALFKINQSIL